MKKPDFKFEHLSDKARLYVLSKEIKTTCEEIKKYQNVIKELRELEAHEKLNLVNLKADLSGKLWKKLPWTAKICRPSLFFCICNR